MPTSRIASAWLSAPALAAVACGPSSTAPQSASAAAGAEPREVRTALVRDETWEETLRVTGELAAFEAATLSTKVPGRVVEIAVDLGSRVAAGDLVAQIEPRDYELRVAQAEAAVEAARARLGLTVPDGAGGGDAVDPERTAIVLAARAELDEARRAHARQTELLRDGVAAQSAFDAAETRLQSAESALQAALEEVASRRALLAQRRAELALAQQLLADARIVAPFDGAVTERLAGTGDFLESGDPVARLVRFDPLRMRLEVPERAAARARAGLAVRAVLEDGSEAARGAIARVSPELDASSRVLRCEVELANASGALRPGSFVKAVIVLDAAARARVIPPDALVRFAGIDKVFAVEGGRAVEKRVSVGRVEARRVEILDGLAAGEEVVLSPGNLQGGASVRVAR